MSARVHRIVNQQLSGSDKCGRDVVIVDIVRTPIGKARTGMFKDAQLGDMIAFILRALLDKTKVNANHIGDVVLGNVLGKSAATHQRMACLTAGLPESTPCYSLSRQCASGFQALANAVNSVAHGDCEVAIAVGAESMTHGDMMDIGDVAESVFANTTAQNCLQPMGVTSDTLATKYGVTRARMDEFAANSHAKAMQYKHELASEITPYKGHTNDEGVRADCKGLGNLRNAFGEGGTTAGNSSQISDGAAAALVCTRAYAEKHNLPILGRIVAHVVTGVDPTIMGVGPKYAIEKLLTEQKLTVQDIDVFEVNEAFASQALWCTEQQKIPADKLNIHGGAIALGHPLGMTGQRLAGSALKQLHRKKQKLAVISACIGTGMGAATLLEAEY